jgi:sortase (surface protein transpeptidase)
VRKRPYVLLAIGLAAGVLAATALFLSPGRETSMPPTTATAPPALLAPARGHGNGKHAQPSAITIPAIGVSSGLVDLTLNPDQTLKPPDDYGTAGWFALGPAPGDSGGPPAVIAGHVDSPTGPAVFYRLRELTQGADIDVNGIDGVVRHFTVYRTADFAKNAFPEGDVYAPTDRAELRLITCTGDFDAGAGSYVSNLVVYATQTGQ